MMRDYLTLNKLRKGEIVSIEGCEWTKRPGSIEPGDWYIAERNTGPKLLTASAISQTFIIPQENAYSYDICECIRVEEVNK